MKQFKDDFLKTALSKSRLKMSDPDFENRVMRKIQSVESLQNSRSKSLRLSWTFYGVAAVFGFVLLLLLPDIQSLLIDITSQNIFRGIQILIATAVLYPLDQLIKVTRSHKSRDFQKELTID